MKIDSLDSCPEVPSNPVSHQHLIENKKISAIARNAVKASPAVNLLWHEKIDVFPHPA